MNKKRLLIFLGVILLAAGILYAQAPFDGGHKPKPPAAKREQPMLDLARSIYKDMTFSEREGVCAMNFTVTNVNQSYGNLDTSVSSVEYLAGKDRVHYRSELFSFFQDKEVALAIVPERQTVFLTHSTMDEVRKKQKNLFALLQNSLFDNCTIVSDEAISDDRSNRFLVLAAGDGMRSRFRIDRVSLKMNTETRSIREIKVDFLPGSELLSTTMRYDKVEWMESTPEFKNPILDLAFTKEGALLPNYRGYRVIDKRGE